jgi:hypothetical protein
MARVYKKYKDYTAEERRRYIRLGERPFTDSKKSTTNIRSKDDKKGTTGTTVNTGAKKETRTSNRNYKRPRYGGDNTTNKKGDYINPKLLPIVKKKPYTTTKKFVPTDEGKKDKKDKKDKNNIGTAAITGASILAARKLTSKPAPKVAAKPKPVTKTTVKPKPPVVKPKTKAKTKPKIGTRTPAQTKVTRLTRAGLMGADTGPSQADKAKAKAETKKPKIGTKTPAQDKVKRLQTAQRRGADTGPSDADKAKAKAEKKQTKTPKKKTVTQNQKQQIKKIAEKGKKEGKSKASIRAAIKKAVPNAAKLVVKVGSRFIPVVGYGLLAADAVRIGKALKGSKLTQGKDDVFDAGVGFKYGGKIPKTMKKGGKVSHYKHGQSIKRGLIKDTSGGQDLVNSIYDTI